MLYNYYYDDTTKKVRIPCDEVFKMKSIISEEHKNVYTMSYEEDVKQYKENSDFMKANWYVDFNISSDRFITLQKLKDNNILIGDLEEDISGYNGKNEYKIMSLDPSITVDRSVLTSIVAKINDDGKIVNYVKNMEILKDLDVTISGDKIAKKVVDRLIAQKIDYIVIDQTGQQQYLTGAVYKEIKARGCKTQIYGIGMQGNQKQLFFSTFESYLFSQSVILPSLDYKQTSKEYSLLLDELLMLKKEKKTNGNGYDFKAVKSQHDDFVMSLLLGVNALQLIITKSRAREKVRFEDIEYYLTLRKYPTDSTPEQKTQRTSWLMC